MPDFEYFYKYNETMKRKAITTSLSLFMGAAITVSTFSYANVGAADDIYLQCKENTFTAADLHAVEIPDNSSVPDAPAPSGKDSAVLKKDARGVSENTFSVKGDAKGEELVDEALFDHDGTRYRISADVANVRSEPSVTSEITHETDFGTEVVRISYGAEWSKIKLEDGSTGYILSSLLSNDGDVFEEYDREKEEEEERAKATPTPTPTPSPTPVPKQAVGEQEYYATLYSSCELNVRKGPGIDNPVAKVLLIGEKIDVVAKTDNGWYKTANGNYVKADLCTSEDPKAAHPTEQPAEPAGNNDQPADNGGGADEPASTPEGSPENTPEQQPAGTEPSENTTPEPAPAGEFSDFASYCLQFVGVPYKYACSSPSGFDCSGLVMYVFANYYGISLPHNAAEIAGMGTPVSAESITCGDVMCHDYNGDGYIDHVSIYIGNGTCIHASDSRHGVITTAYPMGSVVTIRRFI